MIIREELARLIVQCLLENYIQDKLQLVKNRLDVLSFGRGCANEPHALGFRSFRHRDAYAQLYRPADFQDYG